MSLDEIIEQYEDLRGSYIAHITNGGTKEGLLEYQNRFINIKAELRPHYSKVVKTHTLFDDKSATATKFRLALAIAEGRLRNAEGDLIYPKCSINQAEKYAAGSDEYRKFIESRAFWKESYANLNNIKETINSYLIEISNRLKNE